ncbi:MAG TPA: phytanoyl-CoA dioxygenase family protein, partial [Acidimicrobiales bacterium]|nr:phytanoyl-CoA dioxygenase family protein [Acidimicrobiales bacterium]
MLEGAVAGDELAGAQRAVAKLFPTPQEMASGGPELERWRTWDAAWPEFPFRSRSLNRLVVGETIISLAQTLIGHDEVRMYLALATAKYADQPSEYNTLLHTDYPNHTLAVPRPEAGYHQMEAFIYLNDVGPANGATRFVSRRHTAHIPVGEHTLNYFDHTDLYEYPEDASAPAGSIVLYRPDVYHRSVDFADP